MHVKSKLLLWVVFSLLLRYHISALKMLGSPVQTSELTDLCASVVTTGTRQELNHLSSSYKSHKYHRFRAQGDWRMSQKVILTASKSLTGECVSMWLWFNGAAQMWVLQYGNISCFHRDFSLFDYSFWNALEFIASLFNLWQTWDSASLIMSCELSPEATWHKILCSPWWRRWRAPVAPHPLKFWRLIEVSSPYQDDPWAQIVESPRAPSA